MKILLIVIDKESHVNFFPLGIAYLSSSIIKYGYNDLTIFNQEVYHYKDEYIKIFNNEGNFDVIGIGFYGYQQYKKAVSLFKHIHYAKHRPILVLGGHGPSAAPEFFLKKLNADVIVIGEGEKVFCNLLDAIAGSSPFSAVKGIAYRDGDRVIINDREAVISNLDDLPFPAWDKFPMEHYVMERHIAAKHTDRCFPVLASRGCMYNCNFCYRMYKGYRLRSVESVVEEIKKLKRDYSITHITFADENLMCTENNALDFAEGMAKAKLGIKWNCMGRLKVAKPHVLKAMKEAGCTYVNYGIESLDQHVLDLMDKKQTVEEAYEGVENTINSGLLPGLNIIWGNLGDNGETLRKGVEFLKRYNTSVQMRTVKPVTPYPGTKLFDIAIERGLLKDVEDFYNKYTNSDRLTVNFTELPDNEFYKLLFEANKEVAESYYKTISDVTVEGFRRCYFENDLSFRGPRHR